MQIQRLSLTPKELSRIPKKERALVYVLGHSLNEINVLIKLFLIAGTFQTNPRIIGHAQVCQAMVLARALTGKLYETWGVLKRGYFGTKLSAVYDQRLETGPSSDLKNLKLYFGNKNLIYKIRQSFAFHYSLEDAALELPDGIPPEELSIYFAETNGNTLYQFAEYAMGKALLDAINPTDALAAFDQMVVETSNVVGWYNGVAQGLLYKIMEKHMGISTLAEKMESIELGQLPLASDIQIPYFHDTNLAAKQTAMPNLPSSLQSVA